MPFDWVAVIGGWIAKKALDLGADNFGKVVAFFSNKKLAIIGPQSVGKDCFYARLQGKEFPTVVINTVSKVDIEKFSINWALPGKDNVFTMHCKGCNNVGGEKNQVRHWLDACREAEIIFYMLDLQHLKDKTYLEGKDYDKHRVYHDLKWIAANLPNLSPNVRVHFFINKIDEEISDASKLEEFKRTWHDNTEALNQQIVKLFGIYADRICGAASPLSIKDHQIFTQAFTLALIQIHDSASSK